MPVRIKLEECNLVSVLRGINYVWCYQGVRVIRTENWLKGWAMWKLQLTLRRTVTEEWWLWFSHQVVSDSCDPMDCSPPGSSVHGIFPGKNSWEWNHPCLLQKDYDLINIATSLCCEHVCFWSWTITVLNYFPQDHLSGQLHSINKAVLREEKCIHIFRR